MTVGSRQHSGDLAWTLRSFDHDQEAEASWLAEYLLLPRRCLIKMGGNGSGNEDIAEEYGASLQMVRCCRGAQVLMSNSAVRPNPWMAAVALRVESPGSRLSPLES